MPVDLTKLKKLRVETEVSFSLIKKALEESENDVEKAKKLLITWGAKKAADKSDRVTGEGGIFNYVHHNKKIAALVEVLCETDFVSGNSEFQKFGQEIAMQVASVPCTSVEELMKQEYIRDGSKTIDDLYKELVLKFGENIKITRFLRWNLGE
jgi:elongation factor Ts